MVDEPEPLKAAFVIIMAPSDRALFLRRVDDGSWGFPGGCIEGDETPEQCVFRETLEECGYRLGSAGRQLLHRVKDGVDALTYVTGCESEFTPVLNGEHSAWAWLSPEAAIASNGQPEPGADSDIERAILDKLDALEARVTRAAEVVGS